jgi:nucleoside-diphosphate-sugar epimerase
MAMLLVTGVPGWIGTRLVRTLLDEYPTDSAWASTSVYHIRCLVLPDADLSAYELSNQVEIVRGDLRDPHSLKAFCRGADGATLYHCAGIIHPKLFVREFFEVNARGTQNLISAAEEAGVRQMIVLSSNSPAGTNPSREHRFDENSPFNPYMGYGHSKMLMEQAVHQAQRRGRLQTVILRPTWFYGPDQPERQTTFFRMIKNGAAPILGDGGNVRSMTYIDNLCQAMRLSANHPIAHGQTYWIADECPYSMNEIVDTVERLMETEFGLKVAHKRLRLPALAGDAAYWGDRFIQMAGLYQQKIHVLSEMNKTIACSVEKAKKELGYAPAIALEEGMRRSLAWCIEQGIPL